MKKYTHILIRNPRGYANTITYIPVSPGQVEWAQKIADQDCVTADSPRGGRLISVACADHRDIKMMGQRIRQLAIKISKQEQRPAASCVEAAISYLSRDL